MDYFLKTAIAFVSIYAIAFLSGCSVEKYLQKDEYLLYKQNIKGNKKVSKDNLVTLFKQKPNRNILGSMPYLYAWYVGRSKLDTAKVHRDMEKTIAKYDGKIRKIDTSSTAKKRAKHINKVNQLREKRDKKLDKYNKKLKEGNWLMRAVGEKPSFYDTSQTN